MRTVQCFQEGKEGEVKCRKDGGVLAEGPGSTYPPLPPPVWLLSHLEASGRRLSSRRFLSGERRTTEAVAHSALRWRVGVCRRSQGRK